MLCRKQVEVTCYVFWMPDKEFCNFVFSLLYLDQPSTDVGFSLILSKNRDEPTCMVQHHHHNQGNPLNKAFINNTLFQELSTSPQI